MELSVIERAYAKVNPYLDIVGKRSDGYHEIRSYMISVSLADIIEILVEDSGIKVVGNHGVPEKSDLAYKAAELFFAETGLIPGVSIRVVKNIPMQAGLGGGSADAAAVLRGLDRLYGTHMTSRELRDLGSRIGSDVPFCIDGSAAYVGGRGEDISPAIAFPSCHIVIAKGSRNAPTGGQFAYLDGIFKNFSEYAYDPARYGRLIEAIRLNDISAIGKNMYNVFEFADGCDRDATVLMRRCGAAGCLLSGSGSAVFGLFADRDSAERASVRLVGNGYAAFVCRPVPSCRAEGEL